MIQLFTAFVALLGVRLTLGQRVIAKLAYDGAEPRDLSDEERAMATKIFGDLPDTLPPMCRSVFAAVCGRRAGKSYILGALRLLHLALTVPLTTLAPGEVAAALVIAPDLRLARIVIRFALGAAKKHPAIASRIVSESIDGFTIRRPSGELVEISALPATRGGSAVRGRSLVAALLDELAFFRDESSAVNDSDVMRGVSSAIVPGGQLLLLSSPWLESGVLFEIWRSNHGSPSTALVAWAPTLLLRDDPHTQAFVARERQNDPDGAEHELDAKFRGGGAASFFDSAALQDAIERDRAEIVYAPPGAVKCAGGDLGLVSDSSALVVGAKLAKVFRVLETLEIRPLASRPLQLSAVVKDFAAVLKRHNVSSFVADGYSREPAREFAHQHGITIVSAKGGNEAKVEGYRDLQQGLREGRVRLPDSPRLIAQLRAVVARPISGGGMRIESPRRIGGGHGDLVSALVLAFARSSSSVARWMAAGDGLAACGGIQGMAERLNIKMSDLADWEEIRRIPLK